MRDGETLVSVDGSFELGFFSPKTGTSWYLGVWYRDASRNPIVVWGANRERPLQSTSGLLKFSDKGILQLLNDANTSVVWSSNISLSLQASNNLTAQLLNSGNLVVKYQHAMLHRPWGMAIDNIAEEATKRLPPLPLHIDRPLGYDSELEEVKLLLDIGSHATCFVLGIHRDGEIGKFVAELYNKIRPHFVIASFLSNISEKTNESGGGLEHVQETLLSEMGDEIWSRGLVSGVVVFAFVFVFVSADDVVVLTEDNFEKEVGQDRGALVEFYAPWAWSHYQDQTMNLGAKG